MTTTRRLGTADSKTRALLLDGAERLLLRDGYAAVTSRRVAVEVGVKPQLVHYYFRSMDDLFLEVFRRRAEQNIERFAQAIDENRSLRTVWQFVADMRGATFTIEFVALANHRKAIRKEIARYAQRFRDAQLEAIGAILDDLGVDPERCPPIVVLIAMMGVTQVMTIESTLGMTTGHDELLAFAETWLDQAERRNP